MAALTRHWKTQKRAKEDTEKHSRYGKALRSGKKDSKAPKLMGIALNRMERHKADGKAQTGGTWEFSNTLKGNRSIKTKTKLGEVLPLKLLNKTTTYSILTRLFYQHFETHS